MLVGVAAVVAAAALPDDSKISSTRSSTGSGSGRSSTNDST